MSREVESTTDTEVQVSAAMGKHVPKVAVDKSDAAHAEAEVQDETHDASESSKQEEEEPEEKTGKEAGEEEGEETSKEEKSKKPGGFKKRIDKLTKRASLAEQENAALRAELERARAGGKPEAKTEVAHVAGKPVADSYASHDAYVEALTEWKLDQREKAKEAKDKEASEKSELQTKVDSYKKAAEALSEKYEDHDEVIEGCEVSVPRPIQQLLLDSENGAELSYHLAKHEEELERICALPLASAARELGKFEARYLSAPEKSESNEHKTTKAPAPLKPVGAKGSASTGWKDGTDDFQAFKKMREKQLRG